MFYSGEFNPLILPSPRDTFSALEALINSGQFHNNLLITLRRTFIGYFSAMMLGIILAFLLFRFKILLKPFRPIITVIQTVPPIIWLALAVIWFGIAEDLTPIFLIFIVTFPIFFINVYEGLKDVDEEIIEMAVLYSASRKQIIFDIYFPQVLPHLVSAISIGLAFAYKSSIFAEFIGSSSGIGFALSMANSNLETDKLFAWALILVFLMLIVEYLILKPIQNKVTEWRFDE